MNFKSGMRSLVGLIPGLLWVVLLSVLSVYLANNLDMSATLVAILLGFIVGNLWRIHPVLKPGIQWSDCHGLSWAVALLGLQLNATILMQLKGATMVFVILALIFTVVVTLLLAKWRQMNLRHACLLASGQAICGSAAVMATQNIIKAPAVNVGLIIGLVNFLGFLGIFIAAWLIQSLNIAEMTDAGFLIGNTLQSMGHVVAAGFSISDDVGHSAVLIKMCRILLLVPVLLVLIIIVKRQQPQPESDPGSTRFETLFSLVPWFIWVFVILSMVTSVGWVSADLQSQVKIISDALFVMAMVGIGLNIDIKEVWQQGGQWLLLGSVVFVLQLGFTLLGLMYF